MFKKTRDCFSQYHWVSVTVLELAGNTKLPFRTLVSIAWTLRAGHNNAIGPDITRAGCEWDRRHWPQPTVSSRIPSFWFTESSVLSFWISHTVCKPSRNFPVKKKKSSTLCGLRCLPSPSKSENPVLCPLFHTPENVRENSTYTLILGSFRLTFWGPPVFNSVQILKKNFLPLFKHTKYTTTKALGQTIFRRYYWSQTCVFKNQHINKQQPTLGMAACTQRSVSTLPPAPRQPHDPSQLRGGDQLRLMPQTQGFLGILTVMPPPACWCAAGEGWGSSGNARNPIEPAPLPELGLPLPNSIPPSYHQPTCISLGDWPQLLGTFWC